MIKGKIGVEVECLVKYANDEKVRAVCRSTGWLISSDGSIHGAKSIEHGVEFKSKVYSLENLNNMFADFKELAPFIRVNSSCGLHIHLSFENAVNYYKLHSFEFVEQFQNMIKAKFKSQLEKGRLSNTYCSFYPNKEAFKRTTDIQLKNFTKAERYKAVNFNSCNLYNTIEFRIFAPTSKPMKFKKYVNMLVKNVNKFVKKPVQFEAKIEILKERKKNQSGPVVIREIIRKGEH